MLCDRSSLEALEYPSLLRILAALAESDAGRARLLALEPESDADQARLRAERWNELSRLGVEGWGVGDDGSGDPSPGALADTVGRGDGLEGGQLVALGARLDSSHRAAARIAASDPPAPALGSLFQGMPDLGELTAAIRKTLDGRGRVRPNASPELSRLAGVSRELRDELYSTLGSVREGAADSFSEETVSMVEGRLVLLLSAGARGRIQGLVHGRSGSGRSFYFEPLETVEINNRFRDSSEAVEAEQRRLVAELNGRVRESAPDVLWHLDRLARLDALRAMARFADLCDGRAVEVAATADPDAAVTVRGARHPLLAPELAGIRESALGHAGHRDGVVPLDLDLDRSLRVLVITGPNAGGKTVALKTLGLLALAAATGLPAPVARGTRLPHFERLVAAAGDDQDLLEEQSTFSGRLIRLQEAWNQAGPASLVLLDELGSGTDPEEGSALSQALVEHIVGAGGFGVVTTHLTRVAAAALELDGAGCAAMDFDADGERPTYRLVPGPPGGSRAIELARRVGLPVSWLERAESLLSPGHRDLRRLLAEVEAVRAELASRLDSAEQEARRLEAERQRLAEAEAAARAERKAVGRRLAAELEEFKRESRNRLRREIERLERETRRREEGRGRKSSERRIRDAAAVVLADAPVLAESEEGLPDGPVRPGDAVRHRGLGWRGRLESVDGDKATVRVGGKRLRCAVGDLAPDIESGPSEPAPKRRSRIETPDPGEVAPELLLLGRRVEEALEEVEAYLDRALLAGKASVRVVHGHGTGRLKQAVREYLRGHAAVAAQRAAADDAGGDGATVVELRQ